MATGNMVDFKTDVFIDGILPLVLDRNANTNHELGRALGPRWVSTMDIRLEICADEVLMLAPDGALLTFPPAPTDGSEVRADGRPWLLSYADGAYRVRNIAAGLTYSFRLFDLDCDSEDTASPGVKDESPSLGGSYVAAIIPSGSLAETVDAGMEVGLSSVVHHTGASIEYTWDVASGHMVRMRRSDDTILDLEWDNAVGRVAHVYVSNPSTHPDEDPLRLISYAYDAYGQLIRVINSNDGALQYHYDEHGRMDAWTDRNGVSYFYRFDELGRVHSQVGTGGMFPNIVYWADDEGDDAPEGGRLCVAIETAGEFKGDPLELGNSVVDEYFARLEELPLYKALVEGGLTAAGMTGRGRTSSRDDETWTVPVEWLHDDFLGDIRPTVYRSTPSGDVWRIVTANGAVEDTSYDTYHQKISVTNTAGATTSYTYDENGVLVETTDYQGLAQSIEAGNWGTPVRVIDVDGLQTELVVDEFGLVEAVTLPDGTTTQYTSEIRISGIVPSGTIYPDGTMETVQCDDAGRLVGMVDTTGRRANIERDVRGLPGKMLDHTGEATTCEYTVEGWPSRIVHPDGTTVTSSYDREGNRVQSVNELGATTRTRYTIFDEPSETTDASGATTRLEYNTQMQLVRLTNADNKVWSFKYGLDGALIEQTDYNGFTTVRSVSPDGQELLYETAAGKTYRTLFPDGRVKTIRDDWGTTTFRYNSTGKLTGLAGPDAAISFDFDKYGRLTKETSTLNSGESFSHSREYDSVGRGHRCGLRLPLGDEIVSNFGFGESGELDSAQYSFASSSWDVREKIAELQFGNDELGFRNRISGDSVIRSYSTDIRGRRVADSIGVLDSREPTGLRTVNSRVFGWREDNVLQSVIDRERGVTTYELDVLGRVTELQRQTEDHLRAAGDSVSLAWDKRNGTGAFGGVEQYGFSASGLLTSMNVPSAINSDLTGPLAVGSADDRCRRNSQDARIEFEGTLPIRVGRTSYSYDAAGRVVQTVTKRVGKKPLVRSFYYGTGEQPIGYESSDQPDCGYRYLYDPLGRRIAKERVDSETGEVLVRTIFSYVGNQLSAQQVVLNKLGNPKLGSAKAKFAQPEGEGKVWVSDPETGDLVGQIELVPAMPRRNTSLEGANEVQGVREAVFLFLVTDLAGAPMELVHAGSGDLVGFADQTLYGDRVWRGSARTPLLFAGQYLDEESGWAYNRFRYFDPHAGIYNSQDPLGVKPKVSSAQGYVGHPGFQVDIFGLDSHKLLRAEHVQELKGIKGQIGQRFDEVAADWNNGTLGFTEKQLRHIETGNYWASARHRGTQLHMEVFERLRANPIDGVVPTPQGVGGPDYLVTLSDGTEVWLDLTTQGQAAKHVSKYGLWPGLTPSDHIIAYESRSVSGAKSDFRMSVRRLT